MNTARRLHKAPWVIKECYWSLTPVIYEKSLPLEGMRSNIIQHNPYKMDSHQMKLRYVEVRAIETGSEEKQKRDSEK